jgi:hypothetical protein
LLGAAARALRGRSILKLKAAGIKEDVNDDDCQKCTFADAMCAMHEAGKKDGLPGWCNTRISEYLFERAQLRRRGRIGGQQNGWGADCVNF